MPVSSAVDRESGFATGALLLGGLIVDAVDERLANDVQTGRPAILHIREASIAARMMVRRFAGLFIFAFMTHVILYVRDCFHFSQRMWLIF